MGIEVKLGTIAQVVMKLESRPCGVPEGASIRKSRAWDKAGSPVTASMTTSCRSISFSRSAAARPSSRAGALKQSNTALFASIQQRFGVPPGPLLAI